MENNNGRGIFYGVIGVATLVVAIIGATFAFFAASASGTNNAVAANSVTLAGTLKLAEVPDARTNMIPTTEDIMKESYVQTGAKGEAKGKCNGVSKTDGTTIYDLCSSYQFTLTNDATVAQTVYVTLTTVTNTFANLKYCIFDGAGSTETETVACANVPTGVAEQFNVTIPAGQNHIYTVVLYINETGADQTDTDSGKSYAGTISASTGSGENKVTGVIAATG